MKLQTPMRAIEDNLLLTKIGDCWGYYTIEKKTISDNNHEEREQYKQSLKNVFSELGKFSEFHIQMLPQDLELQERFADLEQDFSEEMFEIGHRYNERAVDVLTEELEQVTRYGFVIAVKLKEQLISGDQSLKNSTVQALDNVTNKALKWLNVEINTSERDFKGFLESEKEAFHILNNHAQRITENDLYFMNRYSFVRGFNIDKRQEIANRGQNISDTLIDPGTYAGMLKMNGQEDESYVSTLMLSDTELDLSYTELFEIVQNYPFPVEFHLKARTAKKTTMDRRETFTSRRFKETDREMFQNEDEDDTIVDGKYYLNQLRNERKNENIPYFFWLACFVITGKSKQEVNQRAKTIRTDMKRHDIQVVQPLADQLPLFYKFLQGQSLEFKEINWVQESTPETIAEFSIGLAHQLGSNIGPYFGRVTQGVANSVQEAISSSREIVLFHSFLANEGIQGASTDSPHISITGNTGNGKSFLTKMIFFYTSFLKGQVLMTDPKTENKKWFLEAREDPRVQENYPEFIELIDKIHFVTLDPDNEKNWGILDPISFLKGSRARDTILNIFETIVTIKDTGIDNVIRKSVDRVLTQRENGEKVGLMNVIQLLLENDNEDVRDIGENIQLKVNNSTLQLLFSNGENRTINVDDKLTIIEIEGLELPDAQTNTADQSESERNSVAVMIALAKFCEYFGMRDKSKNTTIIFDEAWTLTTAKSGSKLVKSLRRVGRSYKNQLILVTQSVADIEHENDTGNFGVSFYFDGDSERKEILQSLSMEVNDENKKELLNLKKGQCLFKDMYGRTGQLSVDCLFPEWQLAFETVDQSHSAEAERRYA